jgi:hypothetical protein
MSRAKRTAVFMLLFSMALVVGLEASARTERLRWTHSEPARVDGYRVYYGTDPSVSTWQMIDVGSLTPDSGGVFVYDLVVNDATTIYVAVTAYAGGLESDLSNRQTRLGIPGRPTLVLE